MLTGLNNQILTTMLPRPIYTLRSSGAFLVWKLCTTEIYIYIYMHGIGHLLLVNQLSIVHFSRQSVTAYIDSELSFFMEQIMSSYIFCLYLCIFYL